MQFTGTALALLKRLEGLRLAAYLDTGGKLTIGYGHTGGDFAPGTRWSQERAEATLDRDVGRFVTGVSHLLEGGPELSDEQFSALVIFAFNVGLEALKGSTLLRVVMAEHFEGVPDQLRQWVHVHDAQGRLALDPGLVKRRDAEISLWNSGRAVS